MWKYSGSLYHHKFPASVLWYLVSCHHIYLISIYSPTLNRNCNVKSWVPLRCKWTVFGWHKKSVWKSLSSIRSHCYGTFLRATGVSASLLAALHREQKTHFQVVCPISSNQERVPLNLQFFILFPFQLCPADVFVPSLGNFHLFSPVSFMCRLSWFDKSMKAFSVHLSAVETGRPPVPEQTDTLVCTSNHCPIIIHSYSTRKYDLLLLFNLESVTLLPY